MTDITIGTPYMVQIHPRESGALEQISGRIVVLRADSAEGDEFKMTAIDEEGADVLKLADVSFIMSGDLIFGN